MRKILFFQWHSFMNQGMERALKELGWEYDVFFYQFTDWEKDDKFVQLFLEKIKNSHYTDVLSVNYAPLISDICKEQESLIQRGFMIRQSISGIRRIWKMTAIVFSF